MAAIVEEAAVIASQAMAAAAAAAVEAPVVRRVKVAVSFPKELGVSGLGAWL